MRRNHHGMMRARARACHSTRTRTRRTVVSGGEWRWRAVARGGARWRAVWEARAHPKAQRVAVAGEHGKRLGGE